MKKSVMLLLLLAFTVLAACSEAAPVRQPDSNPVTAPTEAATEPPTEPPTEPSLPDPVFDEAPVPDDAAVTVDGEPLTEVYSADELLWIRLPVPPETVVEEIGPQSVRSTTVFHAVDEEGAVFMSNNSLTLPSENGGQELPVPPRYDGSDWYVPMNAYLESLGFSCYEDAEQAHLYYTRIPDVSQVPAGYDVPILMYHAVSDNLWGEAELFVSPSVLDEQLQYLTDNGYTPIFFEDLVHVDEIEKPVILTFDDGYEDNYLELLPILEKHKVKATIFVIAGHIGLRTKMSEDQLREMAKSEYVSIQSHTMTHEFLEYMDEGSTEYELEQSQLVLTRLTGKQPYVICYPSGSFSDLTCQVAARSYSFGIKMNGGICTTGGDPFRIPRSYISRYCTLDSFREKLGEKLENE